MRRRLLLLAGCLWLLVFPFPCLAKDWNNIFPLKTSRAEVLKILGNPKPFLKPTGPEYFENEMDRVFILWTLPDCFGRKLVIDEEPAGPDALVYKITVEPKDPTTSNYEEEVRELLEISKRPDCIGTHGGSCGVYNDLLGFGYSRSDVGITKLEYFASFEERRVWRGRLKPCSSQNSPDHG